LHHIRSLLAPSGILLLWEVTQHQPWFEISVGLIEGWQKYNDDLRHDSPLMSAEQWHAVLRSCGFEEVVALPEPGSAADVLGQHILVARMPGSAEHPIAESKLTHAAADVLGQHALVARMPGSLAGDPSSAEQPGEASGLTREALRAVEPTERQQVLESYLCQQLARVLGLSASKLDVRQPLNSLGIDSLMGVDLKYRLERDLEIELPLKLLIEGPSIAQLSTWLLAQLTGADTPPSAPLVTPEQLADAKANSLMLSLLAMIEEDKRDG